MPFSLATRILCHGNREQEAAGRGGVRAVGPPPRGRDYRRLGQTVLKICQPRRESGTAPAAPPGPAEASPLQNRGYGGKAEVVWGEGG